MKSILVIYFPFRKQLHEIVNKCQECSFIGTYEEQYVVLWKESYNMVGTNGTLPGNHTYK